MHGTEHCNLGAPSVLPFHSPISDFAVTGSKLQSALQLSPGRCWILVTAFRSPATTAAFTASIPGSTLLACYFASVPVDSTARSVFGSATDPRFASRSAASTPQTRCSFFNQLDLPLPRPPLPFRTMTSFRIEASTRAANSLPAGVGCSRRPFARLQRLRLSPPPFQGQRSWPATSLPCQPIPLPVPSPAPLPTRGLLPQSAASTP
jgi:hypothetical protein